MLMKVTPLKLYCSPNLENHTSKTVNEYSTIVCGYQTVTYRYRLYSRTAISSSYS